MKYTSPSQGNILIVDDTPENLAILTSMLVERGYLVRPAINGEVALRAVERNLPDLILLDIMMPRMSGFEVCKRLKVNEQTREIPVIFISALHKVIDKVKAFSLGGVDYITKPFQLEEVLARVETHLALRKLNRQLVENNVRLEQEITERMKAETALKSSLRQIEQAKQEWEITADSLSYVVCLLNRRQQILRVNRTVEHWELGKVSEMKGRSFHDLFHPHCSEAECFLHTFLSRAWEEVALGMSTRCEEYDPILERYVSIQIRPLLAQLPGEDEYGLSFAAAVLGDITRRKQNEAALKHHNYTLDVLNTMSDQFQQCHTEQDMYEVIAKTGQQLFPNDSGALYMQEGDAHDFNMTASWGKSPPERKSFAYESFPGMGLKAFYAVGDPDIQSICQLLSSVPQHGCFCVPIQTADQVLGILYLGLGTESSKALELQGTHTIESRQMVISRVTKHYALALVNLRLREALRLEAIRDPLTTLYNRRYMEESLERETQRAKRRGTPVGILMFDIDHFKRLNDTYGHEAGDVVLKKIGNLFLKYTRSEDVACRYGGEEFLLILPETQLGTVIQRAEELRLTVKEELRIPWSDMILSITISVGVAAFPNHGATVKAVVSAADTALYQAKRQGRDQVVAASDKIMSHANAAKELPS